jgi:hypothetical protein
MLGVLSLLPGPPEVLPAAELNLTSGMQARISTIL